MHVLAFCSEAIEEKYISGADRIELIKDWLERDEEKTLLLPFYYGL